MERSADTRVRTVTTDSGQTGSTPWRGNRVDEAEGVVTAVAVHEVVEAEAGDVE